MTSTRSVLCSVGLAAVLALGLVGCGTSGQDFSAGFREKISGPDFQAKSYPGTQADAFELAQKIVSGLGYKVTRARAAQGIVEGLSTISSDNAHIGSRQRAVYVKLDEVVAGVSVEVRFTEIIEDSFGRGSAGATENTLRDTPAYSIFFRQMEDGLAARENAAAK